MRIAFAAFFLSSSQSNQSNLMSDRVAQLSSAASRTRFRYSGVSNFVFRKHTGILYGFGQKKVCATVPSAFASFSSWLPAVRLWPCCAGGGSFGGFGWAPAVKANATTKDSAAASAVEAG